MTTKTQDKLALGVQATYDKTFGIVAYGLLILAILFSTYLHHFQPHVLNVPSNTDIASWKNPSFEQTLIHDRMTIDERETLLSQGVFLGADMGMQILADIIIIFIGLLCYLHARKHYGFWMASCFLIGSFVLTGIQESMWILSGRFLGGSIHNVLGDEIWGSYWFTKGGFWFIETPIVACIGWFFIAYSCVLIAGKVFPKMNLIARAAAGGLTAMIIDLWQDPVATSPEVMNWVWAKGDFMLFFGIPIYNFMGWFLLIFVFALMWEELPLMEKTWGRAKATNRFFLTILVADLIIYSFIILSWFVCAGSIASLMGVTQTIQIPPGW